MQVGGLSIQHIQADDHLQIKLSGELDLAAADALKSELLRSENELRTGEMEEVVVDTTQLDFIDSSATALPVDARRSHGKFRFDVFKVLATTFESSVNRTKRILPHAATLVTSPRHPAQRTSLRSSPAAIWV